GLRARALVVDALRAAGLDPHEQAIGSSKGANVIATLPGSVDRWVLVGAHYDHLGTSGGGDAKTFYPGADDNAAAVALPVVVARRIDAEVIPPLSDYDPFWQRGVPFTFLTCGRSERYHTPADTPEHLAWTKMDATARWLERFVRASCARPEDRVAFTSDARD